jgi:hypothetical protein
MYVKIIIAQAAVNDLEEIVAGSIPDFVYP